MIDADGSLTSPGVDVVLDLENGLELDDLRNRVGNYTVATDYDGSLNVLRRRMSGQKSEFLFFWTPLELF